MVPYASTPPKTTFTVGSSQVTPPSVTILHYNLKRCGALLPKHPLPPRNSLWRRNLLIPSQRAQINPPLDSQGYPPHRVKPPTVAMGLTNISKMRDAPQLSQEICPMTFACLNALVKPNLLLMHLAVPTTCVPKMHHKYATSATCCVLALNDTVTINTNLLRFDPEHSQLHPSLI